MNRPIHRDDRSAFTLPSENTGYHIHLDREDTHYDNHIHREMERSMLQRAVHNAERCLFFAIQEQTNFHETSLIGLKKVGQRAHFGNNAWSYNHNHSHDRSFYDSSQCTNENSDEDYMNLQSPQGSAGSADDVRDIPEHSNMFMACEQVSDAILRDRTSSHEHRYQRMHFDNHHKFCNELSTNTCNSSQDLEPMNWSSPNDEEAMLVEQILQCSRAAQK